MENFRTKDKTFNFTKDTIVKAFASLRKPAYHGAFTKDQIAEKREANKRSHSRRGNTGYKGRSYVNKQRRAENKGTFLQYQTWAREEKHERQREALGQAD